MSITPHDQNELDKFSQFIRDKSLLLTVDGKGLVAKKEALERVIAYSIDCVNGHPVPPASAPGTETAAPINVGIDAEYIESGTFVSGEEDCYNLGVKPGCTVRVMMPQDYHSLERNWHELERLRRQTELDREMISRYAAVAVQTVPGDHGEGVEQGASPEYLKATIDYLQKEWDGAETRLALADADRKRPRRRIQLSLKLGADNRDELLRALDQIVLEMQIGHLWGDSCSGGVGSGYYMDVNEDTAITHESYFEAIHALAASLPTVTTEATPFVDQDKKQLQDALALERAKAEELRRVGVKTFDQLKP